MKSEEKHWNIQINIQEVVPKQPAKDYRDSTVTNAGVVVYVERRVTERLNLSIVADSEYAAHHKAMRILDTNMPVPPTSRDDLPAQPPV